MGADAPMPRCANSQGNYGKAMDDCLAPNQTWHNVSWVQSLELCMPCQSDRPKNILALSQKIREELPERDIVRTLVPVDPCYYKACGNACNL